jgi:sphingomyelin phosphodiesterase
MLEGEAADPEVRSTYFHYLSVIQVLPNRDLYSNMKLSDLVSLAALALPVFTSALTVSDVTVKAASILGAFAKRDLASDILTDIEDATTCTGCEVCRPYPHSLMETSADLVSQQALLVVLKALAAAGNTEFVDVITEVCILAVSVSL